MTVKPIDTLLAIKVLTYAPGLTANARAVGAVILDRYNRKTGQCDPGLEGIADHLGINARTVMRSVNRLVSIGLVRRLRHGGHNNRNQYEPNWVRFHELEAEWRARLRRRRSGCSSDLSPSRRQDGHVPGDRAVTQTYQANLQAMKHYSGSRPNEERGRSPRAAISITPRSCDAADAEAERRWSKALHLSFGTKPVTYGEIIAAITPEIQNAATSAERKQRGAGLGCILRRLKLGSDPREPEEQ